MSGETGPTGRLVAAALGAVTVAMKAAGPLLVARRGLSVTTERVLSLLPPAVLAALLAVQSFATGQSLHLDARAAGLAAGIIALLLGAPLLPVVLAVMATTAVLRAITG